MTFQNGLKAGGIGAAVAVLLTLLGLIPFVGCCTLILTFVLWIGVGVLAGYFGSKTNPMQTAGEAAQAGAVAGVITALAGGLVQTVIGAIQIALGGTAQALSQIPPEQLKQLRDVGVDPTLLSGAGGIGAIVVCCCLIGPLLAAALGAGGGALAPSFFKRTPPPAQPIG